MIEEAEKVSRTEVLRAIQRDIILFRSGTNKSLGYSYVVHNFYVRDEDRITYMGPSIDHAIELYNNIEVKS